MFVCANMLVLKKIQSTLSLLRNSSCVWLELMLHYFNTNPPNVVNSNDTVLAKQVVTEILTSNQRIYALCMLTDVAKTVKQIQYYFMRGFDTTNAYLVIVLIRT